MTDYEIRRVGFGDVLFPVEELKISYHVIFVLLSENNSPAQRNFPGYRFFPVNPQSPLSLLMTHRGCETLTLVSKSCYILTSEISLGIYRVCTSTRS
jgi:hypothetical protein